MDDTTRWVVTMRMQVASKEMSEQALEELWDVEAEEITAGKATVDAQREVHHAPTEDGAREYVRLQLDEEIADAKRGGYEPCLRTDHAAMTQQWWAAGEWMWTKTFTLERQERVRVQGPLPHYVWRPCSRPPL